MLRHLHFDAMQSDARIGYCGAMYLESRLQTGWECEKRGCLPFFRRIPVATDSDCAECDDQQLAYQRGTVIHVPILVRSGEGYGKLRGSDDESFPCPLQTSQHGQIGAEIVAGGCLDVAVTELSCDH